MRRWAGALVGVVVLAAATPAGAEPVGRDGAVEALERHLEFLDRGQFGRLYDEMHPASQRLVSEADYVRCAGAVRFVVDDFDVIEVFRERITIPGTDRSVRAMAITIELDGDTTTFHEIRIDGRWRWPLRDPSTFADGECPP